MERKQTIVGRPIRRNHQWLTSKKGRTYAEVVFLGDAHYGSPQFDKKRFLAMIEYCVKKSIYVFLMGDLLETATRHSVGAGVYEQESIPQSQYEQMEEWLTPLAKKKLILGLITGNHEERIYKETGVDVSKMLARTLEVPYLGDACWNVFHVGTQSYTLYTLHGRSNARFEGTALLAVERIATSFHCDLLVHAHMHKLISSVVLTQRIVNGSVHEHKKYLLISGSYLRYDGGYAQTSGMQLSKLGSPKVKFYSQTKDIYISY